MDQRISAEGLRVWTLCALFFLYEFFLRTVMGTYQHPLMQDLELNSFSFSLLSTTIFMLLYGVMQIPAGIITDKIGLKRSLLAGSLCCSIASAGFSFAQNFSQALVFRMMMGFGASFGFIGMLISVYDWMPRRYSAIFIGLSQLIGTMGPMLGAGPLDSLSSDAGISWRAIFFTFALLGLLLSLFIALFVKNNHRKAGRFTIIKKPQGAAHSLKSLFQRGQPWHLALVSTLLYFTIEYLSENEGRAFLALKGISLNQASYMITISWIGYALGCPLMGFISDLLERRKALILISALLGALAITMLLYLDEPHALQVAFFLLGLSASGQSICFAMIPEQFRSDFVAVGFGLNNAMITLLSALNAPAIGLMLDQLKGSGEPLLEHYLVAFRLLLVLSLLALFFALFFIKESYGKSQVTFTIIQRK